MAAIEFSSEQKAVLAQKLKRYLSEELDLDAGQFECEFFLDYLSRHFGPYYYNQGLNDAQAIVTEKMADISDALYAMEQDEQVINQ
jgi:uncharacterized protein (DUF2164 family)